MSPVVVDLDVNRHRFVISAPHYMMDQVRNLPSRRFDSKRKLWYAPVISANVADLKKWTRVQFSALASEVVDSYDLELVARRRVAAFPESFSFTTRPYNHQESAVRTLYPVRHCALFAGIGTGKTKIAIDLAQARSEAGLVDSVVVVCPKSVRHSWKREIELHAKPGAVSHLLAADKPARLTQFAEGPGFRWLLVGVESLSVGRAADLVRGFMTKAGSVMMVVDESHTIKTPSASRTKEVVDLGAYCQFRMIMTGSYVTNSVLDLYSQFEFLDPDIIGMGNYYAFRSRYAIMGGYENRQVVGYVKMDELLAKIRPYTYEIKKEEVLDLPEVVYVRRDLDMSTEQRRIDTMIRKTGSTGDVMLDSVLERILRRQQLAGGFVTRPVPNSLDERELLAVPGPNPKVQAVVEIAEETDRSIVVWCQFLAEIHAVATALSKVSTTAVLHGAMSEQDRDTVVQDYKAGRTRFLVANPAVGGTGINGLQYQPTVMVFYSNSYSYMSREQAIGRVNRSGQVAPLVVVDLVLSDSVDELIEAALSNKEDLVAFVARKLAAGDTFDM